MVFYLFSFLLDLGLAYSVLFLFAHSRVLSEFGALFFEILRGHDLGLIPQGYFLFLLIFYLLRAYSTLIFTDTAGKLLFGLKNKKRGRLKTLLFVTFETFLFPFFLLFFKWIPMLARQYDQPRKFYKSIPALIIFFISFAFFIISPLMYENIFPCGSTFRYLGPDGEKASDKDKNFSNYKIIEWQAMRVSLLTSFNDGQYLPLVGPMSTNAEVAANIPSIYFWDTKNHVRWQIEATTNSNLKEILETSSQYDPWFFKIDRLGPGEESTDEKILSLIQHAFNLSLGNVVTHVLQHGPFLGGYIELRNGLLAPLDISKNSLVEVLEFGDRKYLLISQNDGTHFFAFAYGLSHIEKADSNFIIKGYRSVTAPIWDLEHSQDAFKKLIHSVFNGSHWTSDIKVAQIYKNEWGMGEKGIYFHDKLSSLVSSKWMLGKKDSDQLYYYYYDLGKSYFNDMAKGDQNAAELFKLSVVDSLESWNKLFENNPAILSSKLSQDEGDALAKSLVGIKKAVLSGDGMYFK